jgi:hypothetical protein
MATVLLLLFALLAPLTASADDGADARLRAGQAIYRDGVLASGAPLQGVGAAGVLRQGAEAACIACHRRSGFGLAEGAVVVRPITAPDLFQDRPVRAATPRIAHQLGTPRRPPYDAAALANALRNGVDVTGRTMYSTMPRYTLGDADMAALTAYLKSLYAAPDAGVDDSEIHLATVIEPDVAPARRKAVLDVLNAFVRDKNAGVRSELARRAGGAMRMHRSYRSWTLDVWQLTGAPETWPAQLEEYYRRRPVFALVSGIGDQSWQPVHDFSERFRVPCILPLTSLPGSAGANFYTIYFSRGIALEAQALAGYLGAVPVTEVYRPGLPASRAAADAFRKAAPAGMQLTERALEGRMTAAQWAALADGGSVLVLWLDADDLREAPAFARGRGAWLSASLLGTAEAGQSRFGLTYPWELPQLRAARVRRSSDWLRARGIGGAWLQEQVNAHYAITMVGEALAHLMDSFSRDYFVETIEHDLSTTLLSSLFPPLTLGPDQRYASKGVYLLDPAVEGATPLRVPEQSP